MLDGGGTTPTDYCLFPETGCAQGEFDSGNGCCTPMNTPILIDTNGDGFVLTDVANGVWFDMNGDGVPEHVS
jgi:hypothetical protein